LGARDGIAGDSSFVIIRPHGTRVRIGGQHVEADVVAVDFAIGNIIGGGITATPTTPGRADERARQSGSAGFQHEGEGWSRIAAAALAGPCPRARRIGRMRCGSGQHERSADARSEERAESFLLKLHFCIC
jgi:hypothetical protein